MVRIGKILRLGWATAQAIPEPAVIGVMRMPTPCASTLPITVRGRWSLISLQMKQLSALLKQLSSWRYAVRMDLAGCAASSFDTVKGANRITWANFKMI